MDLDAMERLANAGVTRLSEVKALIAEVRALREDAERYRWIRDDAHNGFPIEGAGRIGNFQVSQKVRAGEAQYFGGRFLDEAIDAARGAK
jgi:hypothetical protein